MHDRGFRVLTSLARALYVLPILTAIACQSDPFDPALAYGIASVRVTPDSATVSSAPSVFTLNGTADLSVVLLDHDAEIIARDIVPEWTSSDESVAVVTHLGTVIGLRPGEATVTATVGSVRGYATITVLPSADTGIIIAAHRGFRSVSPENTLVAIASAFERGADAVEVDIQLTIDHVPILMHDPTVDRTTNGVGAVRFLTLVQIEQLDACSKFGRTWSSCPVPTLRDALETARGHGLLILDMKGQYTNAALTSLIDMVRRESMSQRVIFANTDYRVLEQLRQIDSAIPLGFFTYNIPLVEDIARLGRAVGMPEEHALFDAPGASSSLMRSALTRQVEIMVWTASSVEDARALVALGVRGIMTDVPLDRTTLQQTAVP